MKLNIPIKNETGSIFCTKEKIMQPTQKSKNITKQILLESHLKEITNRLLASVTSQMTLKSKTSLADCQWQQAHVQTSVGMILL